MSKTQVRARSLKPRDANSTGFSSNTTVIRTESKTIRINGLSLHYIERLSDETAAHCPTTAILLHGSSGNARIWNLFAPKLAEHMPTLAVDLRGHGQSDHTVPAAYAGGDYLNDLEQLVKRLEIARAVIVAHSMSVFHSIRYSADNPGRVAKLVLIDIEAACRPEHRDFLKTAGQKPHPVFATLEEAISRDRRIAPFAPLEAFAGFVEANLKATESEHANGGCLTYRFDRATLAQFDDYDEWGNLGRVTCPTLIVYGERSQLMRPEVIQAMKRELTDARVAEVPQAGHLPMLDNPEAFEKAVLDFCVSEAG